MHFRFALTKISFRKKAQEIILNTAIEVKDSQIKPETPNASHATPHFWREMQMGTLQARQVDRSLRSRRLEVVGTRKNGRLPRARPFSLSPTTSKRLLRRLSRTPPP